LLAQIWLHLVVFESFMEVLMHDLYIRKFLEWRCYLGRFLHLKPTAGCQISTLIFLDFFGGRTLLISHEKLPMDGKVLSHLGFISKVLSRPLTDLCAWVGFCTSSPQQGVKYQLWYLDFFWGETYEKLPTDGKVLSHLGFKSKVLPRP
jgi:hypothetical protein